MLIHVPLPKGCARRPRWPKAQLARWLLGVCLGITAVASAPAGVEAQARLGRIEPVRARLLPSPCPGSGDFQHVLDYDGSLGQTRAFVDQHKGPVGRIASNQLCTGTLISRDLFLTAGHCIDAITVGSSKVDFNYEKLPGSNEIAVTTSVRITSVVEDGRSPHNLDYAIFQLEGTPGSRFGSATIEEFPPAAAHLITIIQHPQGQLKQVEVGHIQSLTEDAILYDDLDTEHGSSGSGILDDAGQLVGVHSGGDCASGGPNVGIRMDRIIAASPTVRGLLPGTLLARKAKISRLQVQDVGAPPESADEAGAGEAIDAEAIVWLQGFGDQRFAFNLRTGTDASTHQGMFDQLRSAYRSNLPIRIEYYREGHRANRILRVIQTDHTPFFIPRPPSNIR